MTTITETCGCGASITVTTTYASDARYTADDWRKNHQHGETVAEANRRAFEREINRACLPTFDWEAPDA